MGTITDGSRYGTAADASVPPSQASMPPSTTDNYQVTHNIGQPGVAAHFGAPLPTPSLITDTLDTYVNAPTNGHIFAWENTPNRYSSGLQIQAGTGITAVYISLSSTALVQADQTVVNGGAALPSPSNANWTQVTLTDGYAYVDGQVHGIQVVGTGRVTFLSR